MNKNGFSIAAIGFLSLVATALCVKPAAASGTFYGCIAITNGSADPVTLKVSALQNGVWTSTANCVSSFANFVPGGPIAPGATAWFEVASNGGGFLGTGDISGSVDIDDADNSNFLGLMDFNVPYSLFNGLGGSCGSNVGQNTTGGATGMGANTCSYAFALGVPSGPSAGAGVSAIQVRDGQVDSVTVGPDGLVNLAWESNNASWNNFEQLKGQGFSTPGAPVTMGFQGTSQVDAFVVDTHGRLNVFYENGTGPWQGPYAPPASSAPMPTKAPIAWDYQVDSKQMDVFYTDVNGAIWYQWVGTDAVWQPPQKIFNTGVAGAPLATAHQGSNQLDLFFFDSAGALNVMWVDGYSTAGQQTPFGQWTATGPGYGLSGSNLATGIQGGNQIRRILVRQERYGPGLLDGAVAGSAVDGAGRDRDGPRRAGWPARDGAPELVPATRLLLRRSERCHERAVAGFERMAELADVEHRNRAARRARRRLASEQLLHARRPHGGLPR